MHLVRKRTGNERVPEMLGSGPSSGQHLQLTRRKGNGPVGKHNFGGGPGCLEQLALTVRFERVGAGPVAVGHADIRVVEVVQQFEVLATRKRPDVVFRAVENLVKRVELIGVEGHTNNTDKHVDWGLRAKLFYLPTFDSFAT